MADTSTIPAYIDPGPGGANNISVAALMDDIRWLYAALQQVTGGSTPNLGPIVPAFDVTPDGFGMTVSLGGQVVKTIALPNRNRFRGPYAPNVTYGVGQVVTYNGSSYYCSTGFKSTDFATDAQAGKLIVNAAAGRPAVNNRGPYVAATTYSVGDGVTVADPAGIGSPTLWTLVAPAPAGTAPGGGSTVWAMVALGTPLDSGLIHDATYGYLHDALAALTAAAQKAQAAATAAKGAAAQAETDAQAGISAAAAARAIADANTANIVKINNALQAAGIAGFPVTLTQPAATGSGTSGSGNTGTTGGGTTGSGSTGSTGQTAWSGPSGAQAAYAATPSPSSSTDVVTAPTTTVYAKPFEVSYTVYTGQRVVYRYSDGSTLASYVNSTTNRNDGTYTFTFLNGATDILVWSGSTTSNSSTGTVSTGSTSTGTAYVLGTGTTTGNVPPFVEAAPGNLPNWEGVLSTGAQGNKTATATSAADAHGNVTVTFSDGSTFTHS